MTTRVHKWQGTSGLDFGRSKSVNIGGRLILGKQKTSI